MVGFLFFELDLKIREISCECNIYGFEDDRRCGVLLLNYVQQGHEYLLVITGAPVTCLRLETILFKECLASAVGCAPLLRCV